MRAIEYGARLAGAPSSPDSARYVGRVGALAVALGVGSAIAAAMPVSYADTTGSGGSTGDSTQVSSSQVPSSTSTKAPGATGPQQRRAPGAAAAAAAPEQPGCP
ncbi:MAG: hypothetical protein ACKOQ4_05210, partial [Mycobacterium sp.]